MLFYFVMFSRAVDSKYLCQSRCVAEEDPRTPVGCYRSFFAPQQDLAPFLNLGFPDPTTSCLMRHGAV